MKRRQDDRHDKWAGPGLRATARAEVVVPPVDVESGQEDDAVLLLSNLAASQAYSLRFASSKCSLFFIVSMDIGLPRD